MASTETVIRFDKVQFEFGIKVLLEEVSFSVREGMKMTVMGQNGAGKSTMFKLMMGEFVPKYGKISIDKNLRIAISRQIMLPEDKELTVQAFFRKYFADDTIYNIDARIAEVLEIVNLKAALDKIIGTFSGGQQARLLLAAALIQKPDILLLDEPTNNLDRAGIDHLTDFLRAYKKTCIVISHDAEFLNAFTDGVLYLDIFTKKVEQFVGDYYDVVERIKAQIERENMKNAQLAKEAQANKEQANVFAHKGGKLRLVAKKMRDKAEELEDAMVDSRREDRAIKPFIIPIQEDIGGTILSIQKFSVIENHEIVEKTADIKLGKDSHLALSGPNGIGKTTLLETLASGKSTGVTITPGIRVGYYRQDFSTLDFDQTVYDCLSDAIKETGRLVEEQYLRGTAAGFLITGEIMKMQIRYLSEGQKGLVSFARLVLLQPGLLILDEPTNHINFRHLPIIAEALDAYEGALVIVSHVDEFLWQIRIDEYLELDR
ncbi:MAG: ATP-binding cassette domain-containing protein [Candidatus Gracilibacteria bacterium]